MSAASGGDEAGAALPEPFAATLTAIENAISEEVDADDALRRTIALLGGGIPHYTWLGLYFVDDGELVLGPSSGGEPSAHPRLLDAPVRFGDTVVAVIGIDSDQPDAFGALDEAFLARVGELIAGHCLVGWDTDGVAWEDVE